jgi:hypothetical protein
MTKKQFCQHIKSLCEISEFAGKLEAVLNEFSDREMPSFVSLTKLEVLIYNVIRDSIEDEDDWIGYWLWELNQGKDAKKCSVKIGGKCVPIKTPENLYDLIIKSKKNEKEKVDKNLSK